MKYYKKIEIPARSKQTLDKTTCDICRRKIENEYCSVEEVKVELKTGNVYPDGGSGENIEFDICKNCFEEKLIPWFKEQGAEPQVTEWDW